MVTNTAVVETVSRNTILCLSKDYICAVWRNLCWSAVKSLSANLLF